LSTVTVTFEFALKRSWFVSQAMFFAVSVTAVTGVVGTDGDALADVLDEGGIFGKPVSFCCEHAVTTMAIAKIRASAVNVRRIRFPFVHAADAALFVARF
jgi:hypothetical protein